MGRKRKQPSAILPLLSPRCLNVPKDYYSTPVARTLINNKITKI